MGGLWPRIPDASFAPAHTYALLPYLRRRLETSSRGAGTKEEWKDEDMMLRTHRRFHPRSMGGEETRSIHTIHAIRCANLLALRRGAGDGECGDGHEGRGGGDGGEMRRRVNIDLWKRAWPWREEATS